MTLTFRPVECRMPHSLIIHPDSHCFTAARVEVGIARPDTKRLVLCYELTGKMNEFYIPPVTAAARTNELWRHTCFEAFVGASSGAEYYEFNFAPSTQWAAYRFNGYRSGMCVAEEIDALPIEVQITADSCRLRASLDLDRLAISPRRGFSWRLGLSAVVEDRSGNKSYWALAHPAGKPDFHHMDGFLHTFYSAEPS